MNPGSLLEFALVGLLRQQPQSGYDLRKMFATTPMRHFSDSPGSIYPALRRLEARGWITSKAESGSARKRQVFRVTAAGKNAFLDWLITEITREDIVHRMDDLMLRFAFLGDCVDRDVTLKFVDELVSALEGYAKELREYYKNIGPGIQSETGKLAFESGIQSYEATLQWARSARKKLEKPS